jgi:hypothetical protein
VILPGADSAAKRSIRLGWVVDFDDENRQFLILFGQDEPKYQSAPNADMPFSLTGGQAPGKATAKTRPGQQRFRFQVLAKYGCKLKSYSNTKKPVALPPGRDRLSTKPEPTGSARPVRLLKAVRRDSGEESAAATGQRIQVAIRRQHDAPVVGDGPEMDAALKLDPNLGRGAQNREDQGTGNSIFFLRGA